MLQILERIVDGHGKLEDLEEKGFEDIENFEIISKVLKNLNGTYKYIFKKRFVEEKSQSEIAKDLGVSQMTISRAEKKILKQFNQEFTN